MFPTGKERTEMRIFSSSRLDISRLRANKTRNGLLSFGQRVQQNNSQAARLIAAVRPGDLPEAVNVKGRMTVSQSDNARP